MLQVGFALFLVMTAYGRESALAFLFLIPPALTFLALYIGPDIEERRMIRALRKARLKNDLTAFSKD